MDDDGSALVGFFVIIGVAVLLGLIPAKIAQDKGRSFGLWWLYGAALFIFAIVHALLLEPDKSALEIKAVATGSLKCPNCAEWIKREAKVCRYCGRDTGFDGPETTSRAA